MPGGLAGAEDQHRDQVRRAGDARVGEDRLRAGAQHLLPVPQRGLAPPQAQPGLLRGGDGQRGRRDHGRQLLAGRQRLPLLDQQRGRGAVGARVADHHGQPGRLARAGHQGETEREVLRQVEPDGIVGPRQLICQQVEFSVFQRPGLDQGDGELALGADQLAGREAVRPGREDGAQRLVPLGQCPQGGERGRQARAVRNRPDGLLVDLLGGVPQNTTDHVVLTQRQRSAAVGPAAVADRGPCGPTHLTCTSRDVIQ